MKFKSIFILLNLTLLLFLIALVMLPIFIMNPLFLGDFWQSNWLFVLFLLLILIAFNIFYFNNKKLFLLLEKEDWPALVRHLEYKVIKKGNYSPRLVRLLANSYLVLSDSEAVMNLENNTAIAKPDLVHANVLVFGTARILGKDISGAVRFFAAHKEKAKGELSEWVRWYYGFALLLDRQFEKAADEFSVLACLSKDGVLAGLSSYFLNGAITRALPEKGPDLRNVSSHGSERVLKALPQLKDWDRESARLATEVHAAVLSKYMKETGQWLYA